MPVAQRVLGEDSELVLAMRRNYAGALTNEGITLNDLREALTTLEETERTARRVLGSAHPLTKGIERDFRDTRSALDAREWGPWFFAFAVAVVAWGVWRSNG